MDIITITVGIAFILFVIALIIALQRFYKVSKRVEKAAIEVQQVLHALKEPSVELIQDTNELVIDIKKKSEGLDFFFHPLHGAKKSQKRLEKVGEILGCVVEGIQLFQKIRNEMKWKKSKH